MRTFPPALALLLAASLTPSILAQSPGGSVDWHFSWAESESSANAAEAIEVLGDVNADGINDYAIGTPNATVGGLSFVGRVDVYSGASNMLLYSLAGAAANDSFGWALCVTDDVTWDGAPDFYVSAPGADPAGVSGAGSILLYSGADGALLHQLDGTLANEGLGWSMATISDISGDTRRDLIAGNSSYSLGIYSMEGRFSVFSGFNGSSMTLLHTETGNPGDSLGSSFLAVGDLDQDGTADFLAASPYATTLTGLGSVRLYSGATFLPIWTMDSSLYTGYLGWAAEAVSDQNGDGLGDILVGEPGLSTGGFSANGGVRVLDGATGTTLRILDAPGIDNLAFPSSITLVENMLGDGEAGWAMGSRQANYQGNYSGSVFLYSPVSGEIEKRIDAPYQTYQRFGHAIEDLGDTNGDGRRKYTWC